jgi:CSLREA domain-containing protein
MSARRILQPAIIVAIAAALALVAGAPTPAMAATYTVNSTNDVDDGTCDATHCSLREAINAANASAGSDLIVIGFASPNQTIRPTSPLPAITEHIALNTFQSQPFEIDGSLAGPSADGLRINSEVRIHQATVNRFSGNGIVVSGVQVGVSFFIVELAELNVGVDPTGTIDRGNTGHGIVINDSRRVILSSVVSGGNGGDGVRIQGSLSTGNFVDRGNAIGTSLDGTAAVPNDGNGITVIAGAHDNWIGPPDSPEYAYVKVRNNAGAGVRIDETAGERNTVIKINIESNGGLGIDLGPAGITPNDPLDADTGPNTLQNFPIITDAYFTGPTTFVITGSINSLPNTTVGIGIWTTSACDPSGFGEGSYLLIVGSAGPLVTTDSSGDASFTRTVSLSPSTVAVTTTAQILSNNSEFSNCFVIDPDQDGDTIPNATDNCLLVANTDQTNTDRNFVDMPAPHPDDKTLARSDTAGDACDTDDDNDGRLDTDEAAGCGSGPTDPLVRDSDGDRALDGPECARSMDPNSPLSVPSIMDCGGTGDADADKLPLYLENCFYNTLSSGGGGDSDGDQFTDGARDGCEAASINGDRIVNSGDQGVLAAYIVGVVPYYFNADLNKDGNTNSGDQGLMASLISPPGQCPYLT